MTQTVPSSAELWRYASEHATTSDRSELFDAEAYQKALVTRYVFPVMSGMTLLFMTTYWSSEPRVLAAVIAGFIVAAVNIFITTTPRTLHLGSFAIDLRSDPVDCIRWLVNLVAIDTALVVTINPPVIGFGLSWLIVVLSAQADTFRRRHRQLVVTVGLVLGAILLVTQYPSLPVIEYFFICFCFTAIVFMVGVTETYWIREIASRTLTQKRETEALLLAESLKHDALMGSHLRTVSHELNNMLHILSFASSIDQGAIEGRQAQMIRRAVAYGLQINDLVLKERQSATARRTCTIGELAEDLNLLLSKEVMRRGLQWRLEIDPEISQTAFLERGGSTYFILHNLVKNAWEAFAGQPSSPNQAELYIKLTAARSGGQLLVSVADNAGGIKEELRHAILSGSAASSKEGGHGLGLRFVLDECQRNGFRLDITSSYGVGSVFQLALPVHATSLASPN